MIAVIKAQRIAVAGVPAAVWLCWGCWGCASSLCLPAQRLAQAQRCSGSTAAPLTWLSQPGDLYIMLCDVVQMCPLAFLKLPTCGSQGNCLLALCTDIILFQTTRHITAGALGFIKGDLKASSPSACVPVLKLTLVWSPRIPEIRFYQQQLVLLGEVGEAQAFGLESGKWSVLKGQGAADAGQPLGTVSQTSAVCCCDATPPPQSLFSSCY